MSSSNKIFNNGFQIVSLAVEPGVVADLKLTATVEGVTVSQLIRQLIDEKLSHSSYSVVRK